MKAIAVLVPLIAAGAIGILQVAYVGIGSFPASCGLTAADVLQGADLLGLTVGVSIWILLIGASISLAARQAIGKPSRTARLMVRTAGGTLATFGVAVAIGMLGPYFILVSPINALSCVNDHKAFDALVAGAVSLAVGAVALVIDLLIPSSAEPTKRLSS